MSLPGGLTNIGTYAFSGCTKLIGNLELPSSLKNSIGVGAFQGCTGISSLIIPESITSMAMNIFSGCTGIHELTIPISTVTYSLVNGNDTFYNCTGITKIVLTKGTGAGVNYTTGTNSPCYAPWWYSRNNTMTVTIDAGITSIGNYSFYACPNMNIRQYIEFTGRTNKYRNICI